MNTCRLSVAVGCTFEREVAMLHQILNKRHLRELETSISCVCIGSKTRVHLVDIMKQAEDKKSYQLIS